MEPKNLAQVELGIIEGKMEFIVSQWSYFGKQFDPHVVSNRQTRDRFGSETNEIAFSSSDQGEEQNC